MLTDANLLIFGDEVASDKFTTRKFSDLADVVADKSIVLDDEPAYFMYRNVRLRGDEKELEDRSLRFDLTVIPKAILGKEYAKTLGHYHPKKPGTAYSYPELYYVVSGQATYVLQRKSADNRVDDVILARVMAGNAVIMPPNYGHVTVNELDEPLVMANWVDATFESEYQDYKRLQGAANYIVKNFGLAKAIVNLNYVNSPAIKEMNAKPKLFEEMANLPIYRYKQSEVLDSMVNLVKYNSLLQVNQVFTPKF
jgi:glucose-6-phosphate isomerase